MAHFWATSLAINLWEFQPSLDWNHEKVAVMKHTPRLPESLRVRSKPTYLSESKWLQPGLTYLLRVAERDH
jgi:hypothetical protein